MIWRIATLAAVGVLSGYFGYLASDRESPLTLYKMEMVPQEKPSPIIQFRYEGVRHRLCDVSVARFLFGSNGIRYTLPNFSYPANANNLGGERYTTQITLPPDVPIGATTYRTVNCYVCNPLHKLNPICTPPRDIHFEVTQQMVEARDARDGL